MKDQQETDGKLVFTTLNFIRRLCAGSNLSVLSVPFPSSLVLLSGASFFYPHIQSPKLGMEVNSSIISLEN